MPTPIVTFQQYTVDGFDFIYLVFQCAHFPKKFWKGVLTDHYIHDHAVKTTAQYREERDTRIFAQALKSRGFVYFGKSAGPYGSYLLKHVKTGTFWRTTGDYDIDFPDSPYRKYPHLKHESYVYLERIYFNPYASF